MRRTGGEHHYYHHCHYYHRGGGGGHRGQSLRNYHYHRLPSAADVSGWGLLLLLMYFVRDGEVSEKSQEEDSAWRQAKGKEKKK